MAIQKVLACKVSCTKQRRFLSVTGKGVGKFVERDFDESDLAAETRLEEQLTYRDIHSMAGPFQLSL